MARYRSSVGRSVELTNERRKHIIERHPDVEFHIGKIKTILLKPDEIRVDKYDQSVLLFYKRFSTINKYLVVVIKVNQRNFILTLYSTYRIKTGEVYEIKS